MTNLQSPPSSSAETAREEAKNVAATAVEQGKTTASSAAEAGGQVAGTAAEGAKEVAVQAAQQAGEVKQQASEQARQLLGQAQSQVREQAESQTQRASSSLKDFGQQLRGLAEGQPKAGGIAENGVRQLAEKVEEFAERLDERGLDGTVEDLRRFARQKPGLFLLGATAAGFAIGRLGKGLKEAQEQERQATALAGTSAPQLPPGRPAAMVATAPPAARGI